MRDVELTRAIYYRLNFIEEFTGNRADNGPAE
jgi:hypothetical protein